MRAKQAHKDIVRYCGFCDDLMTRKRYSNGVLESNLHFKRRKYCNRECMRGAFIVAESTSTSERVSRQTARRMIEYFTNIKDCRECGGTSNLDVHHIDGNPFNNTLSNLEKLCRSCHIKTHRGGKPCSICDNKHKGLGYCDKHYQRYKKFGDPYMTKWGKRP